MLFRVCRSKSVGVAGYTEDFWSVQSEKQASDWSSYFQNAILVSSQLQILVILALYSSISIRIALYSISEIKYFVSTHLKRVLILCWHLPLIALHYVLTRFCSTFHISAGRHRNYRNCSIWFSHSSSRTRRRPGTRFLSVLSDQFQSGSLRILTQAIAV